MTYTSFKYLVYPIIIVVSVVGIVIFERIMKSESIRTTNNSTEGDAIARLVEGLCATMQLVFTTSIIVSVSCLATTFISPKVPNSKCIEVNSIVKTNDNHYSFTSYRGNTLLNRPEVVDVLNSNYKENFQGIYDSINIDFKQRKLSFGELVDRLLHPVINNYSEYSLDVSYTDNTEILTLTGNLKCSVDSVSGTTWSIDGYTFTDSSELSSLGNGANVKIELAVRYDSLNSNIIGAYKIISATTEGSE